MSYYSGSRYLPPSAYELEISRRIQVERELEYAKALEIQMIAQANEI